MANSTFHFLPELLSVLTLAFCFISILCAAKFFGKSGLYVYSAIASIASNIQVLKLTQYSALSNPIALGTVLFSTTFAVDNIITEYYGAKYAKKGLYISFFGCLFFTVIMQITILHPIVFSPDLVNLHFEIKKIFSPTIYLFMSSLIAYFVGQWTDIFIYSALKKISGRKYLSARSMVSMTLSTFIDNFFFSFFAWIVFAERPIPLSVFWNTYVIITYVIRLIVAALCLPLVKLAGILVFEKKSV